MKMIVCIVLRGVAAVVSYVDCQVLHQLKRLLVVGVVPRRSAMACSIHERRAHIIISCTVSNADIISSQNRRFFFLPFVTRWVLMDWLFSFRSLDGNLSAHHTVSMGSLNYIQIDRQTDSR